MSKLKILFAVIFVLPLLSISCKGDLGGDQKFRASTKKAPLKGSTDGSDGFDAGKDNGSDGGTGSTPDDINANSGGADGGSDGDLDDSDDSGGNDGGGNDGGIIDDDDGERIVQYGPLKMKVG